MTHIQLTEAQARAGEMLLDALDGNVRAKSRLTEAISTSDIPVQLRPTLTLMAETSYNEVESTWTEYATRDTTPDFESHRAFTFEWDDKFIPSEKDGKEFYSGGLAPVGELGEYPSLTMSASQTDIQTRKNGVRVPISWEAIVRSGIFGLNPKAIAVMGKRGYIAVDELCAVTGKSRKKIESDLDYMVEKGLLGTGAYLDSGRGIFFRSADAFADYANATAKKENVTPKEANEGYAGALRAIRSANDRIADPVLSEKIDHLETVAGKIFREVEEHPEKQQQAATFLNYYLPTTLKLLDSYAKFEEAGIEGENLSRAQERIEETMDALIKGFDKQLDDLYRNEAMDIDSDIRVMENMLRRDTASVEDDFGLGGTAVQRAPDEE